MAKIKANGGEAETEVQSPETTTQTSTQTKVQKPVTDINEMPIGVKETLKAFHCYESLYIDTHGGCFTPDTPAIIRGNATLYKNPFHKQ